LLLGAEDHKKIDNIIEGVIEGETRVLAASMAIEEIFNGRDKFKQTIITQVQNELDQFGLVIYNANVKELQDMPGSEYFKHMRQKTRAGAENQARVEIANAKYLGDIGEKEKQRDTRIQAADFESAAVQKENERAIEMAKSTATYQIEKAEADRRTSIARIESAKAAEMRSAELQKDVETRMISQQTEKLRSEILAQTMVESEAIERRALADLFQKQKAAEADLFQRQKAADAHL
jgi:flotillin